MLGLPTSRTINNQAAAALELNKMQSFGIMTLTTHKLFRWLEKNPIQTGILVNYFPHFLPQNESSWFRKTKSKPSDGCIFIFISTASDPPLPQISHELSNDPLFERFILDFKAPFSRILQDLNGFKRRV